MLCACITGMDFQVLMLCTSICCWFVIILFYFHFGTSCQHTCYCAMRLFLACFKLWDGMQNFIPNIWQVVFANIFVQGLFTLMCMAPLWL